MCVYFGIISWYLFPIIKFPKALIWNHQESTWFSHNRNAWKTWRKGMEMCVPQSQNHDDESKNIGIWCEQRERLLTESRESTCSYLISFAPACTSHENCKIPCWVFRGSFEKREFFLQALLFKLYWQSNLYSKAFWQQGSTLTIKKLEASSQKSKSGDMCILKSDITKYVHVPLIIFVWF